MCIFQSIVAHSGIITGLEIDDVALVTSGLDHCIKIWDSMLMDGDCYFCLKHDSSVTSISICQKHIVSSTNKGYIYIWNMLSGIKLRTLEPYTSVFSQNIRVFAYNFSKQSHNLFMVFIIHLILILILGKNCKHLVDLSTHIFKNSLAEHTAYILIFSKTFS